MADQTQSFQKLMSLYPYWNNNPGVDQYELNRQVSETHRILPEPDKAFVPPAPALPVSPGRPSVMQGGPGGAASMMDMTQSARGQQREAGAGAQRGRNESARVF